MPGEGCNLRHHRRLGKRQAHQAAERLFCTTSSFCWVTSSCMSKRHCSFEPNSLSTRYLRTSDPLLQERNQRIDLGDGGFGGGALCFLLGRSATRWRRSWRSARRPAWPEIGWPSRSVRAWARPVTPSIGSRCAWRGAAAGVEFEEGEGTHITIELTQPTLKVRQTIVTT